MTVTINGKVYQGNSLRVAGRNIIADGDLVENYADVKQPVNIIITGDIGSLSTDSGEVTVHGAVGCINSESGNVTANNISGNISTKSGNVYCNSVSGSVSTKSGDIYNKTANPYEND